MFAGPSRPSHDHHSCTGLSGSSLLQMEFPGCDRRCIHNGSIVQVQLRASGAGLTELIFGVISHLGIGEGCTVHTGMHVGQ